LLFCFLYLSYDSVTDVIWRPLQIRSLKARIRIRLREGVNSMRVWEYGSYGKLKLINSHITYTREFVTSKDGTEISYRQFGKGAGLILAHGGMMASPNLMRLGKILADEFTIYIEKIQKHFVK